VFGLLGKKKMWHWVTSDLNEDPQGWIEVCARDFYGLGCRH
jgi:hypothetical protein